MFKIITNEKLLRNKCEDASSYEVDSIIKALRGVLKGLEGKAVGLAAPQIGIYKNVICFTPKYGNLNIINPIVLKLDKRESFFTESCFSLPYTMKKGVTFKRPKSIKIKFTDEAGNAKTLKFKGVINRAIQHEMDHLNGILIIDKFFQ